MVCLKPRERAVSKTSSKSAWVANQTHPLTTRTTTTCNRLPPKINQKLLQIRITISNFTRPPGLEATSLLCPQINKIRSTSPITASTRRKNKPFTVNFRGFTPNRTPTRSFLKVLVTEIRMIGNKDDEDQVKRVKKQMRK